MNSIKSYIRANSMRLTMLMVLVFCFGVFGGHMHPDPMGSVMLVGMADVVLGGSNVRIVDPVLTTIAQGYKNQDHVGTYLFPRVPVGLRGGQIIEFGKESFKLYNLRRAPGGKTKRVRFGYAGKPYAIVEDAVEGQVPREFMQDASVQPGIDLGQRAVKVGMDIVSLSLENDQAALARTAANYDNNHKVDLNATKWSADANKPANDIKAAREAIRASVGVYPNTLLLSATAFNAIINNANIIDRFKYTSRDSITAEMLANLFNIKQVVVGGAISFDDGGNATDIWGNDAVLAYTALGTPSAEEPSYGYTYTLNGNPFVEPTYWDPGEKSWIYPVTYERAPVLSGITAGYLFQNVA